MRRLLCFLKIDKPTITKIVIHQVILVEKFQEFRAFKRLTIYILLLPYATKRIIFFIQAYTTKRIWTKFGKDFK